MVDANQVEGLIGHAIGGVCPFAVNEDVEVYLDVSLQRFTTVFPACGSTNSAIELTIKELEKHSKHLLDCKTIKGESLLSRDSPFQSAQYGICVATFL